MNNKAIDINAMNNPESSFTTAIQKHVPFAYAYFINCYFDNNLNEFYWYVTEDENENVSKRFVEDIMFKIKRFYEKYLLKPKYKELNISKEKRDLIFKENINKPCVICGNPFEQNLENIVIDHCHLTNKINGLRNR